MVGGGVRVSMNAQFGGGMLRPPSEINVYTARRPRKRWTFWRILRWTLAVVLMSGITAGGAVAYYVWNRLDRITQTSDPNLKAADKQLTQIGEAHFDQKKCIVVVKGTDCAACSEHCPTKAVHTIPYGDNLRLPEVTRDLCIGCGACEYACPVLPEKAIVVAGHRRHGRARKPVETKAAAPTPAGDFPF